MIAVDVAAGGGQALVAPEVLRQAERGLRRRRGRQRRRGGVGRRQAAPEALRHGGREGEHRKQLRQAVERGARIEAERRPGGRRKADLGEPAIGLGGGGRELRDQRRRQRQRLQRRDRGHDERRPGCGRQGRGRTGSVGLRPQCQRADPGEQRQGGLRVGRAARKRSPRQRRGEPDEPARVQGRAAGQATSLVRASRAMRLTAPTTASTCSNVIEGYSGSETSRG